ncbi:MAG TPA: nascent polypeptide-associated complex protein [Ignavibacteria bacterium]|nr:nascent polypeptide-associated complex protein [Ignavibacteria bacterium]
MFPNMNPKKMQQMMKQMGIAQENINASRVIIEKEEGKIIIENPSVVMIKVQGQESFQISGDVKEEVEEISEQDIKTIMEKTGTSEEEARKTLEKTSDLAEAILELSE